MFSDIYFNLIESFESHTRNNTKPSYPSSPQRRCLDFFLFLSDLRLCRPSQWHMLQAVIKPNVEQCGAVNGKEIGLEKIGKTVIQCEIMTTKRQISEEHVTKK